jgi:hypothetical protein
MLPSVFRNTATETTVTRPLVDLLKLVGDAGERGYRPYFRRLIGRAFFQGASRDDVGEAKSATQQGGMARIYARL